MLKKVIVCLCILFIVGSAQMHGMEHADDDKKDKIPTKTISIATQTDEKEEIILRKRQKNEDCITYLGKNTFVTSVTACSAWFGESLAVDIATDFIQKTKSPNRLLDWTFVSAIRGKELQEALPIAQKNGKLMGIVVAGMTAPLIWDCSVATLRSWSKIIHYIFDDNIESDQMPTKRDYLKATLGMTIASATCLVVYKSLGH